MKSKTKKHPLVKAGFPRLRTLLAATILLVTALFLTTLISYQLAYQNRIYPGIKIAGINVGNKSTQEATQLLTQAFLPLKNKGITFSFEGESRVVSLADLEANFNFNQTVSRAFTIGRHPHVVTATLEKIAAWNGTYDLQPDYYYSNDRLNQILGTFNKRIYQPMIEAKFHYSQGQITVAPPRSGQQLNFTLAGRDLNQRLISFSAAPIVLTRETLAPTVSLAEAEKLKTKVQTISKNPIKLTFGNKKWEIKETQLIDLISFGNEDPVFAQITIGNTPLTLNKVSLPNGAATNNRLHLNPTAAGKYLDTLTKSIDQDPINARFVFEGGRVVSFQSSQDGQKLDTQDTFAKINQLLFSETAGPIIREIPLKVTVTKAAITTDKVNNLGIKDLLGFGTSKFVGSIGNRQDNIALASGKLQGTLVEPGETFSMYKILGEVDGSTGYKEAYIIYNGRTKLDFGGGVCQVSTTLFRAVLNSGLPVIERNPHAFRVGYYEQDSAPGVDASVFFPESDFRFKNDTENYLLIQSYFNRNAATLTFEIYGTSDGRQVVMTKPVVYDQTPPPPDVNQDDPTLPMGTVKKVENAVPGATTNFSRTVTRNGEVIIKENFYTKYVPWRAIYLHGTKV